MMDDESEARQLLELHGFEVVTEGDALMAALTRVREDAALRARARSSAPPQSPHSAHTHRPRAAGGLR